MSRLQQENNLVNTFIALKKQKSKKEKEEVEYLNSSSENPILFCPESSGGSNNLPYCSHLTQTFLAPSNIDQRNIAAFDLF